MTWISRFSFVHDSANKNGDIVDDNRGEAPDREHDRHGRFIEGVNDATIRSGEFALQNSMFINGGAAVTVLAFLGAVVGKEGTATPGLGTVATNLGWFACGAAFSLSAMLAAYLTNYFTVITASSQVRKAESPYIHDGLITKRWRVGKKLCHWLAVILGLLSIIMFVIGLWEIQSSISRVLGAAEASSAHSQSEHKESLPSSTTITSPKP